jgi:hypothetical protein
LCGCQQLRQENLDILFDDFFKRMADWAYLDLACEWMKAVERAMNAFVDKTKREAFYRSFQELETLFEILSPDEKNYALHSGRIAASLSFTGVVPNKYGAQTTFR